GLTHELAFDLTSVASGFTVGHLRLTDVGFNVELALHAVNQNVQVQLAHTTNDGLAGLFVGAHTEGRIFLGQLAQCNTHLFLVSLGLRLDGNVNHRLREVHPLEDDLLVQITQGVTGGDVLHADQGSDIASADFLDLFAVVGLHLHHTTYALFLALDRVDHGVARRQDTRINTNEGQRANEGVGSDLERQRGERLVIAGLADVGLLVVIRMHALDGFDFVRSRQEVDDSIQYQRHALVLEGRTTDSRNDLAG